ncbi:MAG: bifunctional cobalt-precorrin-7 (C(5))-methyltransferase/cobalt-precorrin-6B (C(15))-methyltransferase, partial [Acidimicrobiales bacterium]
MREPIRVFGMPASPPPGGRPALVVGAERYLDQWVPDRDDPRRLPLGDVAQALDAIDACPGPVWVLASGDPGFFGIVRRLAERFGPDALEVQPA